VTNFGAVAILKALPENAPARQLRVLIAIETFPADRGQWREAGQQLLARTANVSVSTLRRARLELDGAGLISYRRGGGRGRSSRFKLNIPDLKGVQHGDTLSKGVQHGEDLPKIKVFNQASKGVHQNALTCENENGALSTYVDALSGGQADPPGPAANSEPQAIADALAPVREMLSRRRRP
jgi:hypothetical protein